MSDCKIIHISIPHAIDQVILVNKREWRFDFHKYLGPTWLKKDGELRKCQCPTNPKVWKAFDRWLREWEKFGQ